MRAHVYMCVYMCVCMCVCVSKIDAVQTVVSWFGTAVQDAFEERVWLFPLPLTYD